MKKHIWRLHSWLGLVAGLGLFIIGVSGSILVFRAEIDSWISPENTLPSSSSRLDYDTLFAKARQQKPGWQVTAWYTALRPDQLDMVGFSQSGSEENPWYSLDASTGLIVAGLYGVKDAPRSFTSWLLDLHYSFLAEDVGVLVAGVFALMLCLLGVTGLYLYRDFWRHFFRLRWRASARIWLSDLHKFIGISSVIFNLILGFTGAWWNLAHLFTEDESHPPVVSSYNQQLLIQDLLNEAQQQAPGFDLSRPYINLPPHEEVIRFRCGLRDQASLRSTSGSHVDFDPQTGRLLKVEDIRQTSLWNQFEDTFSALHYGTFGGWPVRALWCLLALAPGLLAISGFMLWRSRARKAAAA